MSVRDYEVLRLNIIKDFLKEATQKEGSDCKGIYSRLVDNLKKKSNHGYNIRLDLYDMHIEKYNLQLEDRIKNLNIKSRIFTEEEVREISLNKFARYLFYELGEKGLGALEIEEGLPAIVNYDLNRILGSYAYFNRKELETAAEKIKSVGGKVSLPDNTMSDWLFGLDKVADRISNNYGTPIEVSK